MDANGNGHGRGAAEAQPDFLALTHGQEWVQFYESFDKLVQDNLSRSSELLRKAMTLPEVADREVAQVKNEMEAKLATERKRQQEVLTLLRDDVGSSHRQVSTLARSIGSIIADLERLSTRVVAALAVYSEPAEEAAPAVAGTTAGYVPAAAPASPAPFLAAPLPPMVEAVAAPDAGVPQVESELEGVKPFVVEEIAAQGADESPLAAATDATPIDLSALAEAEAEAAATAEQTPVGDAEIVDAPVEQPVAAGMSSERPRPHWLSVTRIGNQQS